MLRKRPSALLLLLALAACRAEEPAPPPPPATPPPTPAATVTPPPPPVPEIAGAARPGNRVLFVGLDGADWQILDEQIAAGKMPHLARLVSEGRGGVLTSLTPPLCPLLWTSMMTGVGPVEHGILDFTRADPASGREEPIRAEDRRVPAVWTLASAAGRSVALFGMWATYPGEPVRGLVASDRSLSFVPGSGRLPSGVIHPAEREPWAREILAEAERATGFEAVAAWLPGLDKADYDKRVAAPDASAHPVSALRRTLADTRSYDGLARSWLARETPDLAIVYIQGTDTIAHAFAPLVPPRQETVPAADFQRYSRVPDLYFAEMDRWLGEYRQLAETSGAVLMLASDHGFFWKEGRPPDLASAAAVTAGRWHRDEGIYLLWGPGIVKSRGERSKGGIEQVHATLLSLLGLPPAKGAAGPPLPGTPVGPKTPAFDYRAHLPASKPDEKARTIASYNNEGLLLRAQGKQDEAIAAFESAIERDPKGAAVLWNLSDLLFEKGEETRDRSDELLARALAAGLPEGAERTIGRAVLYQREKDLARSLKLLDAAVEAKPEDPRLLLFRGRFRLDTEQCQEGLADLERSRQLDPKDPITHGALGLARLCLGDKAGAAKDFRKALELDPNQQEIRRYLEELEPPTL